MDWKPHNVSPLATTPIPNPGGFIQVLLSRWVLRDHRVWGIRGKWGTVGRGPSISVKPNTKK